MFCPVLRALERSTDKVPRVTQNECWTPVSSASSTDSPRAAAGTLCTPLSATAALVIASGVLGRRPSPAQVTARLRATARKLGAPGDQALYGAGLLNAGAATAPGGPGAVAR